MKKINLAIVGATGLVGRSFIKVLEEYNNIKIKNLYLFASKNSEGKVLLYKHKEYKVIELTETNILKLKKCDYALFSAGGDISRKYASCFNKIGAIVIDNSSAFRMVKDVPLIVPEVNNINEYKNSSLIANPNCSTIQCMLPLKIINDLFSIKQVNYTTFQAVSGSGNKGILDLQKTQNGKDGNFYPYPIYNNVLPQIDKFLDNGYTNEEMKMINETKKILNLPKIKITATCVRVPIYNSHSVDISVLCSKNIDVAKLREKFKNTKGLLLVDDIKNAIYPTPTQATGQDNILVGRIRRDINNKNCVHLFCVADNIRKGASSNAIQILEKLLINKDK